ncbi:MAG: acyltransferase [Acetobacter indonesiensis]|nr:acyltransferase [Acetobacter indonesiensis]MCI1546436.1 acyltransferase [Acetobacter indonesiensis]MCI1765787.1 acyltransferase [Acetobacter indonesiensis]
MKTETDQRWVVPERGNRAAMGLAIWLAKRLGWRRLQFLLWPIAVYFFVCHAAARRASRMYLSRILRQRAGHRLVVRHFHTFAQAVLDRLFFLMAPQTMPAVRCSGRDAFLRIMEQGQGCLLLGAHIGSFEALRALGRDHAITLKMLMYRSNLGGATQVLEALDPSYQNTIIPIGQPETMLQVAESLQQGHVIGILGDRSPDTGRTVTVPFLGKDIFLPEGPYRLALATGVPILLLCATRGRDGAYEVRFEPFNVPYPTSRKDRPQFVQDAAERYARWMQEQCAKAPFSWFNFYDYWKELP